MAARTQALLIALLLLPCSTASGQEKTSLISVNSSGSGIGNGSSSFPSISTNGRFVAFSSKATNLVANDADALSDIYVRDLFSGVTELVSVDSAGVKSNNDCYFPAVSGDGRFVVFYSKATNLVANDTNKSSDIFLRDRKALTTIRVSVDSSGAESNAESFFPSVSANGLVVAYSSDATNLVAGDTNAVTDMFAYDVSTGITERVSVDSSGIEGNGSSSSLGHTLSADGRFVGFDSNATNFASGDTNSSHDVFVRDRVLGTTQIISLDSNGAQGDAGSVYGAMSGDGRYVVFNTVATNLVPNDTNGKFDVLLRDVQTSQTELVSMNTSGATGDLDSVTSGNAIDDTGQFVVFFSDADDLVPGDTNGRSDIFVHDRTSGVTHRVSVDSSGNQADGSCDNGSISADGRFTTFSSYAKNLVPPDFGSWNDIFLHGPYLTMEADPQVVLAGATLAFSAWRGAANGGLVLAVTDVNGAPLFLPAAISTFDASGAWSFSATVPSGLAGNDISFETFGIIETGKVNVSNAVTVSFQ